MNTKPTRSIRKVFELQDIEAQYTELTNKALARGYPTLRAYIRANSLWLVGIDELREHLESDVDNAPLDGGIFGEY